MLSVLPIPSESDHDHIIVFKLGFISDYPFDGVKSVSKMWSTNYWLSLQKFDNRVVHEGGQRVCLVVKGMLSHLTFKTHSQSGSRGSGRKTKTKQSYNAVQCTFEQAQVLNTVYLLYNTMYTHRMFNTLSMSDRPNRNISYTNSNTPSHKLYIKAWVHHLSLTWWQFWTMSLINPFIPSSLG